MFKFILVSRIILSSNFVLWAARNSTTNVCLPLFVHWFFAARVKYLTGSSSRDPKLNIKQCSIVYVLNQSLYLLCKNRVKSSLSASWARTKSVCRQIMCASHQTFSLASLLLKMIAARDKQNSEPILECSRQAPPF